MVLSLMAALIRNSSATGKVDGGAGADGDKVGGLVGNNRTGTIQNSSATGKVDWR